MTTKSLFIAEENNDYCFATVTHYLRHKRLEFSFAPSLPQDGEFVWDEQLQGIILGSFFWGYILTNLVGGRLAELVGGRLVMGVGVFGTAFFTVLSPLFAKWSTTAFVVLRVLEGMCEVRIQPPLFSIGLLIN